MLAPMFSGRRLLVAEPLFLLSVVLDLISNLNLRRLFGPRLSPYRFRRALSLPLDVDRSLGVSLAAYVSVSLY